MASTHDDFLSISGLLGSKANSKLRIRMNKIALISTRAKR